jgi:hypothetical protein
MEPTTTDVFRAHFADCHFYEDVFQALNYKQHQDQTSVESLRWQIESGF